MTNKIQFHGLPTEDVELGLNKEFLIDWLLKVCETHQREIQKLYYFFITDEALLEINRRYLSHDYFTDIITFPYSGPEEPISGEIYVSLDRVSENASIMNVSFRDEFHRVCVHGLLHLMGFDDATEEEKGIMRKAEDNALILRPL